MHILIWVFCITEMPCLTKRFESRKVLDINPNDSEAYYNLGNVFNKKNLFDDAIDSYKKATAINSNDAGIFHNLGNAYAGKG